MEITPVVLRVLSSIERLTDLNNPGAVSTSDGTFKTLVQASIPSPHHKTSVDTVIHDVVMAHALTAEKASAGSFIRVIRSLRERFEHAQVGVSLDVSNHYQAVNMGDRAAIATVSDLSWLIATHVCALEMRVLAHRALTLAGFGGRIVIERGNRLGLELVRGHVFEHTGVWNLNVRLARPRVVCIDGYVDSVSEVHRLLQDASENSEPVIVFARGMHADVLNTLRVNFDRGTLRVIPVIVPFDLSGINTMIDVSVVTGSDLVSSTKGDLISSISLEAAPVVSEIVISGNRASITNPATTKHVSSHIASLRKKRDEQQSDELGSLIDKRIRSMSPNHVVVRLVDDQQFLSNSVQLDAVFRAFKSLVDHGTVVFLGEKLLTKTAIAVQLHSDRCYELLSSVGAVITA